MTEPEIKHWLGLDNDPRPLAPAIVDRMAGVPVPASDDEQIRAFEALLGAPAGSTIRCRRGRA